MATRIFAVLNQKGGVGKTTTCVNLGAGLARAGRQVVLIDMDPQANLTVHLGFDPHEQPAGTTYSVLLGDATLAGSILETNTPGLRLVPSTLGLANAQIQLASAVGRELILSESILDWLETADAAPQVDFVLIDCPPSLGILTMNALCAATDVLLPIQTEFFALQGVAGILESLKAVQRLNKGLQLSMVLPSMADFRTNLARDVLEEVRKYFGRLVTQTVIRTNVKLAEAPSHGQTIFEYAPTSRGAQDYTALAAEVLGIPLVTPDAAPQQTPHGETRIGYPEERDIVLAEAETPELPPPLPEEASLPATEATRVADVTPSGEPQPYRA